MGLHYTTHLAIVGADGTALTNHTYGHHEDILDACDQLVAIVEALETDTRLPRSVQDMADKHAAELIRLCYDRVLLVDEQHSVRFTQPGAPMVTLTVTRHEDIPGTPTPTLVDNLTGQSV